MKTISNFLTLIFLLFIYAGCSEDTLDDSGTGTITGIVVQAGSNEPVENAKISTNPATSTVFTDEKGEFILQGISAKEYSVEAKKEGFLTQFEGASVMANATVNVVFEIETETSGNNPPEVPQPVSPEDGAQGLETTVDFIWVAMDPEGDELVYQLEIRNDQDEEILVVEDIMDTTYTVEGLNNNSKYFWQISASDGINSEVLGPINSFETMKVPENNRILFTRLIDGNSVIFGRDLEGTEYRLTSPANNSFRPRKSNSSNKIAFLRVVNGETHLFTMNLDGTEENQVTSTIPLKGFNLNQIDYSWAFDGSVLVYPHFNKLYRINISGGGTDEVFQTLNGEFITEVHVSNSNDKIALITNDSYGYNGNILTINFDGSILTEVLSGIQGAVGGLDLSVSGDLLLYAQDISNFQSGSYRRLDSHLFLYNFNTGSTIDLSLEKPDGTNDLDPRFSPNDAEVIFVNTSNDDISRRDIYTINLEDNAGDSESRTLLFENGLMPDWE